MPHAAPVQLYEAVHSLASTQQAGCHVCVNKQVDGDTYNSLAMWQCGMAWQCGNVAYTTAQINAVQQAGFAREAFVIAELQLCCYLL